MHCHQQSVSTINVHHHMMTPILEVPLTPLSLPDFPIHFSPLSLNAPSFVKFSSLCGERCQPRAPGCSQKPWCTSLTWPLAQPVCFNLQPKSQLGSSFLLDVSKIWLKLRPRLVWLIQLNWGFFHVSVFPQANTSYSCLISKGHCPGPSTSLTPTSCAVFCSLLC